MYVAAECMCGLMNILTLYSRPYMNIINLLKISIVNILSIVLVMRKGRLEKQMLPSISRKSNYYSSRLH